MHHTTCKGSLLDVSASFGMDGDEFVNVGELCWSTTLCGGPYKLIKAGSLISSKEVQQMTKLFQKVQNGISADPNSMVEDLGEWKEGEWLLMWKWSRELIQFCWLVFVVLLDMDAARGCCHGMMLGSARLSCWSGNLAYTCSVFGLIFGVPCAIFQYKNND
ncbi:hypothetical protein P8452_42056 [Trifolium repens]|nr:hypothetical protein P8452_42056 [Trifolium repens]